MTVVLGASHLLNKSVLARVGALQRAREPSAVVAADPLELGAALDGEAVAEDVQIGPGAKVEKGHR